MTTANDPWGRVDADGTVYVRTADGERAIGSWAAGSPEEALEFFRRKFQSLETEVALIEQRIAATEIAPAQANSTVQRLLKSVAEANALGDLDGLRARLEALTGAVNARREEVKAAREHARSEARDIKERIVEEAEHIAAEATHWKAGGERLPSSSRSGRPHRTPTGRSRPCCGSGCPRPATPSPSGARRTSLPWRRSEKPFGHGRRGWSRRPRRWRTRRTGAAPRASTAT